MTAVELLERVRSRGITLTAVGGRLECEAPPGVMTDAVRAELQRAKPALLRILVAEALLWDEAAADALVSASYRRVGEAIPGGALPFYAEHAPELATAVDLSIVRWEAAYNAEDLPGLSAALAAFVAAMAAVREAYAARQRAEPAEGPGRRSALLMGY